MSGAILWANLHLLFWLSLFPFVTGWMGENHFAPMPTAVYGVVLLMAGDRVLACLQRAIIASDGPSSVLTARGRQGLEGQAVAALLRRRDRVDVLVAMGRTGALRVRRVALADTGPAHRARAQAPSSHMKAEKQL